MAQNRLGILLGIIIWLAVGSSVQAGVREPLRVLVWSERTEPKEVYPKGINGEVAGFLNRDPGIRARAVSLGDREKGLTEENLAWADVLVWWGHTKHGEVPDPIVDRIVRRVREGKLGFVAIHSSHRSKPFRALVHTTGNIAHSKQEGVPELVKLVLPLHPIARGVTDFTLPKTEPYCEPFEVPAPDEVIFRSDWGKGDHFRSGCTWTAERGRVFYFQPGHETYREFDNPNVRRVIRNGCYWVARRDVP